MSTQKKKTSFCFQENKQNICVILLRKQYFFPQNCSCTDEPSIKLPTICTRWLGTHHPGTFHRSSSNRLDKEAQRHCPSVRPSQNIPNIYSISSSLNIHIDRKHILLFRFPTLQNRGGGWETIRLTVSDWQLHCPFYIIGNTGNTHLQTGP